MAIESKLSEDIESLYDITSRNHAKTRLYSTAGYSFRDDRHTHRETVSAWEEIAKSLQEAFRLSHINSDAFTLEYLSEQASLWDGRATVQAYGAPERAYLWGAKEFRALIEDNRR